MTPPTRATPPPDVPNQKKGAPPAAEKKDGAPGVPPLAFELEERQIADTTGLQKKVLASSRMKELVQGLDWERVGNAVRYTVAGAQKLMVKLGLKNAVTVPAASETAQETKPEKNGSNAVVVRKFTNRHLMEARFPDGKTVHVKVRDSKNFKPGMAIPIAEDGNGPWKLTRKEPRWLGRW